MNIAVLIIQGVLALMFLVAGILKSTLPMDQLSKRLPWVNDYSLQTVRLIGFSEVLGAIGIIVPQISGVYPTFSPFAALGLVAIMILAFNHHLPKKEYKEAGFNTTLLLLAVIVVIYRF
jgi:uncharacterized membrane protein